jgi:hypothetical protein
MSNSLCCNDDLRPTGYPNEHNSNWDFDDEVTVAYSYCGRGCCSPSSYHSPLHDLFAFSDENDVDSIEMDIIHTSSPTKQSIDLARLGVEQQRKKTHFLDGIVAGCKIENNDEQSEKNDVVQHRKNVKNCTITNDGKSAGDAICIDSDSSECSSSHGTIDLLDQSDNNDVLRNSGPTATLESMNHIPQHSFSSEKLSSKNISSGGTIDLVDQIVDDDWDPMRYEAEDIQNHNRQNHQRQNHQRQNHQQSAMATTFASTAAISSMSNDPRHSVTSTVTSRIEVTSSRKGKRKHSPPKDDFIDLCDSDDNSRAECNLTIRQRRKRRKRNREKSIQLGLVIEID